MRVCMHACRHTCMHLHHTHNLSLSLEFLVGLEEGHSGAWRWRSVRWLVLALESEGLGRGACGLCRYCSVQALQRAAKPLARLKKELDDTGNENHR